jgi:dihydroxyacetone kinase-like protein
MKKLDLEYWKQTVRKLTETFSKEEMRLCDYDGATGDGDHGTSMLHGYREAQKKLDEIQPSDVGALLKAVGKAFVSNVGGVTGIIFGTMFMNAGESVSGKRELTLRDLHRMFSKGLESVKVRGKVQEGQKSMVDALSPAVRALGNADKRGANIDDGLRIACEAAKEGMYATRNMEAKVGRARYHANKGIGYVDAGAASIVLIFEVLVGE